MRRPTLLLAAALLAAACARGSEVDPEQARSLAESGDAFVLDVRTSPEFASGRIGGAVNIPLTQLPMRASDLPERKDRVILVYCLTGHRSRVAADILEQLGYRKVRELKGGLLAWRRLGLPLGRRPQSEP